MPLFAHSVYLIFQVGAGIHECIKRQGIAYHHFISQRSTGLWSYLAMFLRVALEYVEADQIGCAVDGMH